MSGLQERITEAIGAHVLSYAGDRCECGDAEYGDFDSFDAHHAHVAGAVIAALNLREEFTWSWDRTAGRGDSPSPGFGFTVDTREEAAVEADPYMTIVHRWVTDWEPS